MTTTTTQERRGDADETVTSTTAGNTDIQCGGTRDKDDSEIFELQQNYVHKKGQAEERHSDSTRRKKTSQRLIV